jgi:putative transposase
MASATPVLIAHAAAKLSSKELAVLEQRQQVLMPLAEQYRPSLLSIEEAAKVLRLSPRTVRHLLRNYRLTNSDPLAFIGKRAGRPRGSKTLPKVTEEIIASAIEKRFARSQRPSMRTLSREIKIECRRAETRIPSDKAIRSRIDEFNPYFIRRRREGRLAAQELKPVAGSFPEAGYPLHMVQIDHTEVDVMLVDSEHRRDLGRPFITLAIDIYSRCIAGYCLTFDSPSAVSVGLALANMAQPKHVLLQQHGIDAEWPLQGKPAILHTDNGKEFDSEALRRGCAGHGIRLIHRPVRMPWFAGAIERVIGTFMRRVHDEVPGTTFSNPKHRGEYQSGHKATMTIDEFEGWLLRQIVQYHAERHATLRETPLEKLEWGLKNLQLPPAIKNPKSFLIDFLPIERRQLRRDGFRINHITYYDPKLETLIAKRDRYGGLEIRYDPRNLRFVWLQVPGEQAYMEISYRNLTNPDVTLWEHKEALRELHKKGLARIDEDLIMRMVVQRRQIIDDSRLKTKRARRNHERLKRPGPLVGSGLPPKQQASAKSRLKTQEIKAFNDLEVDW